jgi:hypothetical protein
MIASGATIHPILMPGARIFEKEPVMMVCSGIYSRNEGRDLPEKFSSP